MDLDRTFRALSDRYRRRLLVALLEQNPQDVVSIPESIHEGGLSEDRLQTVLRHVHLPMLVDEDIIRWDCQTNQVTRGPNFDTVEPLLELLRQNQDALPGKLV